MSILDVVQKAVTSLGIEVPTVVYASTDRDMVEMKVVISEMATRLVEAHDWNRLKTLGVLTGNGATETFAFPVGYDRMLKTARLWPSNSPFATLRHYADTDEWFGQTAQGFSTAIGGWTLIGETIAIRPIVPSAATVRFYYISNQYAKAADSTLKSAFTLDADTFRLSERLLKLGIVWQWKASKGQPYAEDLTTFEEALAQDIGTDKGSNILTLGRSGWSYGAELAFPGVIVP